MFFRNCETVIGRETDFAGQDEIIEWPGEDLQVRTWGISGENDFILRHVEKQRDATKISLKYNTTEVAITISLTDDASIENAITCCCLLLHPGIDKDVICKRMKTLQPVNMRLERKKGINHCSVINDSYSAGLSS